MSTAAERLTCVRARISDAALRSGRSLDDVRLIAVSKKQSGADLRALADLGVRDFGESQIQEAQTKIAAFSKQPLIWHFIGHLQSNKTRFIPGHFDWVHAVDSVKLVKRINVAAAEQNRFVKLLLQVNVARDPAKYGLLPDEVYAGLDEILQQDFQHVAIRGLMTIGFAGASEQQSRSSFVALRELLSGCRQRFGDTLSELSMGMSRDFEWAIEEGATMVRVGTGLFGARE